MPAPASSALSTSPSPITVAERGQWWRCLFDESEDAQLVCAVTGGVVEANRKAMQVLGLPAEAGAEAHGLDAFFTAPTIKKLQALFQRRGGLSEQLSGVTLLSRGQLGFLVDLRLTPLSADFVLLTLKDASRRWRLESHAQRTLRRLIRPRTSCS